jgi:hypothetical protein
MKGGRRDRIAGIAFRGSHLERQNRSPRQSSSVNCLFVAQGLHGVEAGRAACWVQTRQ